MRCRTRALNPRFKLIGNCSQKFRHTGPRQARYTSAMRTQVGLWPQQKIPFLARNARRCILARLNEKHPHVSRRRPRYCAVYSDPLDFVIGRPDTRHVEQCDR